MASDAGEMAEPQEKRLPSIFRANDEEARRLRNSVYPNNFFDGLVASENVPAHVMYGVEDDVSKTQLKFAHRMHVKNEQLANEADDGVLKDRLSSAAMILGYFHKSASIQPRRTPTKFVTRY